MSYNKKSWHFKYQVKFMTQGKIYVYKLLNKVKFNHSFHDVKQSKSWNMAFESIFEDSHGSTLIQQLWQLFPAEQVHELLNM